MIPIVVGQRPTQLTGTVVLQQLDQLTSVLSAVCWQVLGKEGGREEESVVSGGITTTPTS